MKKFVKIINKKTKAAVVGLGTNESFYRSEGMSKTDVEQGYDGNWYVAGFAPEKPDDVKKSEIRAVRNQYLAETDKYMIADFPVLEEERARYRAYRQYLRDYTKTDGWFDKEPAAFDDF